MKALFLALVLVNSVLSVAVPLRSRIVKFRLTPSPKKPSLKTTTKLAARPAPQGVKGRAAYKGDRAK